MIRIALCVLLVVLTAYTAQQIRLDLEERERNRRRDEADG